jgi:tRNA U38,U39,U40 pseudouridine synthase TruA
MIKKLSNRQGTGVHSLGQLRELVREYQNKLNEVIDVINEGLPPALPPAQVTHSSKVNSGTGARSACCDAEVVIYQHNYYWETRCDKCKKHCGIIHCSI